MATSYVFAVPVTRRGNKLGQPSNIPPEQMVAFACNISYPTLGAIPWDCGCPHVPISGAWLVKFRWRACPVHWM